jgi:hypothetical protein
VKAMGALVWGIRGPLLRGLMVARVTPPKARGVYKAYENDCEKR